jgi:hypothetical protein
MVESWGKGQPDFTGAASFSGLASISGNIVSISGDLTIRGAFIYRPLVISVTAASGGQAVGSGLTYSGYSLYNVVVKNPYVVTSGSSNYHLHLDSGQTGGLMWMGGNLPIDRPFPGGGYVMSGKGLLMEPGETKTFSVQFLERLFVASETSGRPLSIMLEMK